ncbi:MAG: hypothetical protein V1907_02120 [Candidatus Kerfeldbacteria bacterium]
MHRKLIALAIVIGIAVLTIGIVNAKDLSALVASTLTVKKTAKFSGSILNPSGDLKLIDNVRVDGRLYRGTKAGPGLTDSKPLIINDDAQVTGNLAVTGDVTVNGVSATVKKVYAGTFDPAQDGDSIISGSVNTTCTLPTDDKVMRYHWKKIAIPEIVVNDMPSVDVYYEVNPGLQIIFPVVTNGWANFNILEAVVLTDGYAYSFYKSTTELCNGTVESSQFTTGKYKVVVVY